MTTLLLWCHGYHRHLYILELPMLDNWLTFFDRWLTICLKRCFKNLFKCRIIYFNNLGTFSNKIDVRLFKHCLLICWIHFSSKSSNVKILRSLCNIHHRIIKASCVSFCCCRCFNILCLWDRCISHFLGLYLIMIVHIRLNLCFLSLLWRYCDKSRIGLYWIWINLLLITNH